MNDFNFPILLVEFLAKSTATICLGFAISILIRRVSPAEKHRLWMLILSAGLAIPVLLLLFSRWEILPVGVDKPVPEMTSSASVESILVLSASDASVDVVESRNPPGIDFSWRWMLVSMWGLGLGVLVIRSILATVFLRRLESDAGLPAKVDLQEFERLRQLNGIRRPVSLLISSKIKSPFTWGIRKPRIVLPETDLQTEEREMILLHELEHVRRHDSLAVFISRIFFALNWVNPLAWIAIRQITSLREEACDQRVINAGHDSGNYAEMLFRQARSTSTPLLRNCATAVAETGTIEHRIKMILNSNLKTPRKSILLFSKVLPVLILAGIVGISIAGPDKPPVESGTDEAPAEVDPITKKLNAIIIPSMEFQDTPLKDAISFLQLKSKELDSLEDDPKKKGVNMVLGDLAPGFADARITLKLSNVPLIEALRYAAQLAGGTIKVEEFAVLISSAPTREDKAVEAAIEIKKKLKTIIIPSLEFNKTELSDAIQFLQLKSVELDATTDDRSKKGVNFIIKDAPKDVVITLKLSNIPLGEAIRYMTALSGMTYEIDPHAVVITPKVKKGADPFGDPGVKDPFAAPAGKDPKPSNLFVDPFGAP